eukprot:899154_1
MGSSCCSQKQDYNFRDRLECYPEPYDPDNPRMNRKENYQRILLLGNSNSGKSTFFKLMQLKVLSTFQQSKDSNFSWIAMIRSNIHISMITLINAAFTFYKHNLNSKYKINTIEPDATFTNSIELLLETVNINLSYNDEPKPAYRSVGGIRIASDSDTIINKIGAAINEVWNAKIIKYTFKQRMRMKFFIPDNM